MALKIKKILEMYNEANIVELSGFITEENIDNLSEENREYIDKIVPDDIKDSLIKYEFSKENNVTKMMGDKYYFVNYYFNLDDNMRKYLSNFESYGSFEKKGLDDFALLKDDECLYSSSTHEHYDSIVLDYTKMTREEIIEFAEDEMKYTNVIDKEKYIEKLFKLINMDINDEFDEDEFYGRYKDRQSLMDTAYALGLKFDSIKYPEVFKFKCIKLK